MRYPFQLHAIPSVLLVLGITVSGVSSPADAQGFSDKPARTDNKADFNQLSAIRRFPPTLKLSNLNSQWRRFTLSDNEDSSMQDFSIRIAMNMRILERMGYGVYYTKGDSVTIAKETYLVAYRIDNDLTQQDLQNAFRELYGGGRDQMDMGPVKFLPNTKLSLSLLNLHTTGSLNDLTKFDPAREIMGPGEITAASTENLRRLGEVLQQIGQHQNLPLRDVQTMRRAFQNQMHNQSERLFVHPHTKEPYRPNTKLAGKRSTRITNRKRVVAIYEAKPGTDNKRGVVFLDGHVERIPEANWPGVIRELPRGFSAQEIHTQSGKRLQNINRILLRIARSNNGTLPALTDANSALRTLQNWGGYNPDGYRHPKTNQAYRPNTALSKKKLELITNKASVVSFYEATVGTDGKRGAVFLDGHYQRIPESRWKRVIAVAPRMKIAQKKSSNPA